MKKPLRDVSRFSAKAARRHRMICLAIGFIIIASLAAGSALILAFNDPIPLSLHTLEFASDKAERSEHPVRDTSGVQLGK